MFFSLIPGTQKIWMKTWGCSHNNSDGEYMAGQLAASGYKMTGKWLFICGGFEFCPLTGFDLIIHQQYLTECYEEYK